MLRGFVTIATGDERYYELARNLLRSYRDNTDEPVEFAVIADRENEYTAEFDRIVLLKDPHCSWMDKMQLLKYCPFEENIFIDADCLVYRDINYLWNKFTDADFFSCFGKALPLESEDGWFTRAAAERYDIHFITHLHGILYYIRKDQRLEELDTICQRIIKDYSSVRFKAFNHILADEPVYALAMAIMNLHPINREAKDYCFVPFATNIHVDYLSRRVRFSNSKDGNVEGCSIVHWGNRNTQKALYKSEVFRMNYYYGIKNGYMKRIVGFWLCHINTIKVWYMICDAWQGAIAWLKWFFERVYAKLN